MHRSVQKRVRNFGYIPKRFAITLLIEFLVRRPQGHSAIEATGCRVFPIFKCKCGESQMSPSVFYAAVAVRKAAVRCRVRRHIKWDIRAA